jgi:ribosome maturation factor RimP
MGAQRPFFAREDDLTQVYEKEKELHRDVAEAVQGRLPEVEVLAVELGGPELLWVYIDHPEGVDHALCERVTGALGDFRRRYTINVSSPGLERPLRTPAHFADAVGRKVAVKTTIDVAGRKRLRGEVVAAGEREFTLAATGGERVSVPYAAIARGNLIDEGR